MKDAKRKFSCNMNFTVSEPFDDKGYVSRIEVRDGK